MVEFLSLRFGLTPMVSGCIQNLATAAADQQFILASILCRHPFIIIVYAS
jgi:hypothetical protein